VSALLNDLFGIQSRGGCMCAGPYSQWILGLCDAVTPFNSDEQQSSCCSINDSVENALLDKQEVLRPGFTRLSFPYFTPDDKVEYILKAIEFVAEYGVLFLQYYR
jgi:selenocysteine lyase/cysteine desulfurase